MTLLGAIPGPVLFGIFIDKSCGLWEATCHGQGNCLVYDNEQLSYSLAYVIFIFQGESAFLFFCNSFPKNIKKKHTVQFLWLSDDTVTKL